MARKRSLTDPPLYERNLRRSEEQQFAFEWFADQTFHIKDPNKNKAR